MEFKLANEFDRDIKPEIGAIFAEGFGHWLSFFSKDTDLLASTFSHMFLTDKFYAASINGEIAGITACTNGREASVRLDKKELKKNFGFTKGTIAYRLLVKYLENNPYPFPLDKTTGSIEYVGTSSRFRKQGVAESLIKHIIENTPYASYVLEVADTNTNAVRLYEKLGFHEIHRVKEKHTKQSGINYYIYMKYDKE